MRIVALLVVLMLTGCSTAPVTYLLDCFVPSRYEANRDLPRKPRERDDGPLPPGIFLPEPRDARDGGGRRVGLGEPVAEPGSPFVR